MFPTLKSTFSLGIDGCRSGWIAIAIDSQGNWGFTHLRELAEFKTLTSTPQQAWVDIPIGLPHPGCPRREADRLARQHLRPRGSSRVFNPPCREAIEAGLRFDQANAINKTVLGLGLSVQTFNIIPKIREADHWARDPTSPFPLLEAHPEVVFAAANHDRWIVENKKTEAGKRIRYALMEALWPLAPSVADEIAASTQRKLVAVDDIVDALGLAIAAHFHLQSKPLPNPPVCDQKGIRMAIRKPVFYLN